MPEKKHLRGVSDKEQRQYEHIKEEAEQEGRYKGREEEVAADWSTRAAEASARSPGG